MKLINLHAEFCLALKEEEVMKFAGKQMELENIMLRKVTLFQKDNVLPHFWIIFLNFGFTVFKLVSVEKSKQYRTHEKEMRGKEEV